MNKVLVCPVAYNEYGKLGRVIDRYLKSAVCRDSDYLIVDDASDDGTSQIISGYAPQGVKTVKHEHRQGVGAAIRTAIKYARQNNYTALVIMAGNDKDDPEEIPKLITPIINDDYDLVQGSRYKGHIGTGGDMPYYRKVATKLHPWLMSLVTGKTVTDSTNGFRAIRLSIFEDHRIDIDQRWLDHYELEPYLLYKTLTLGYKFMEAPVTKIYPPKKMGYTKMKPVTGWWSILKPLFYLRLGIKK